MLVAWRGLGGVLAASVGAWGCASEPYSLPVQDAGSDTGMTDTGTTDAGTSDAGECEPGAVEPCYTGPAGTLGVGICTSGTKTCHAEGTGFGDCVGETLPAAEACATPDDDDCDGQVNELDEGCMCVPGAAAPCYAGPPGTEGIGICHGGTTTCNNEGTGYGGCTGEVTPGVEACTAPEDEDCDGKIDAADDDCACTPGSTKACYTGPFGTEGIGICHAGTKVCNADGLGYGDCNGEVTPAPETCLTPEDDNCNAIANEGGDGCVCFPGVATDCYDGPPGTDGVGICHSGSRVCNAEGTAYGDCLGQVLPGVETCNTPDDDDCNGITNEGGDGCVCFPGLFAKCPYTGPPGTEDKGICQSGGKVCNSLGTGYTECLGEVLPETEKCSSALEVPEDEDCDGQFNEGVCKVIAIAAGAYHSMALREDGTVWTWGGDWGGQLGDGDPLVSQSSPVWAYLNFVTAIAAGRDHSMALRPPGSVWTWGKNSSGQLGYETTAWPHIGYIPYPQAVPGFYDMAAIAGGSIHSMARRADGTVWTWGANTFGQLGIGTFGGVVYEPIQVVGLGPVSSIAGGSAHSLAVQYGGTVQAWGQNAYGQLGIDTFIDQSLPATVLDIGSVTLVGGNNHSLARRSDGTIWAWGDNSKGQLGDGSTTPRTKPVQVASLTSVTALSAGTGHSLALGAGGTVWAWGDNARGQLGDGTNTDSLTPVLVSGLTGATAVAAGSAHSLALRSGIVWAWGLNSDGQLGNGILTDSNVPVQVPVP